MFSPARILFSSRGQGRDSCSFILFLFFSPAMNEHLLPLIRYEIGNSLFPQNPLFSRFSFPFRTRVSFIGMRVPFLCKLPLLGTNFDFYSANSTNGPPLLGRFFLLFRSSLISGSQLLFDDGTSIYTMQDLLFFPEIVPIFLYHNFRKRTSLLLF